MKKIIALMLLLLTAYGQGCKVRKHITKTKASVDSARVVSNTATVKVVDKDSSWSGFVNKYTGITNSTNFSVDRIKKVIETEGDLDLKFVLNVDALKVGADTLTTVDVHSGTVAKIYKGSKPGEMLVDLKKKGGKKETYELSGLKLNSSQRIDSGSATANAGTAMLLTKDSSASNRDSIVLKRTTETVDKTVKKDFGLLKWIGIIVLIAVVLRLAIWLLRKQFGWVGFLNKLLGGK